MANVGYIDTSAFLALAWHQPQSRKIEKITRSINHIISCELLISEASSAFVREHLPLESLKPQINAIDIISTAITPELLAEVLGYGYVRGADAHHLASALYFAEQKVKDLVFISLDKKQLTLASKIGFKVST